MRPDRIDLPQVRLGKTDKNPMIMASQLINKLPLKIRFLRLLFKTLNK